MLARLIPGRQESFGRSVSSLFFGWMLAIVAFVAVVSAL